MKTMRTYDEIVSWLWSNLGRAAVAPITGTDAKALFAAAGIVNLWGYSKSRKSAEAFGLVVQEMQPSTRELAYHIIAAETDWSFRAQLWAQAGLPPLPQARVCSFERGGSHVDLMEKEQREEAEREAERGDDHFNPPHQQN